MALKDITSQEFNNEVLSSQDPVLVEVWAPWCMPCRKMVQPLTEINDEGIVRVVKVNADDERDLVGKLGVKSIPSMLLIKNGQIISSMTGVHSKDDVKGWLQQSS